MFNPFFHYWPIRATDVFPVDKVRKEMWMEEGPAKTGGQKRNKAKCKAQRKARKVNR